MMRRLMLPLLWCLASGCTSLGLHPDALRLTLEEDASRLVANEVQTPIPLRSGQPLSNRLGLYVTPTGFLRHGFEWTDRDRDRILQWAKGLSGRSDRAVMIPLSSLKGQTLTQLREAAVRYGADRLLIIDGAAEVDRYSNYKGRLLYWTIIGAYLVQGTHNDALCLVRGSLWDVQKGTRLAAESAEGRAEAVGPAATLTDQTVVLQARQRALENLLDKLARHAAAP